MIYDGKPAYFQDSNIVWIDNNEKIILNKFLYYFCEIVTWGETKGPIIDRLYNSIIENIKIPLPPLAIQKELVQKVEQLEQKINQAQNVVDGAKDRKRKYWKGEL